MGLPHTGQGDPVAERDEAAVVPGAVGRQEGPGPACEVAGSGRLCELSDVERDCLIAEVELELVNFGRRTVVSVAGQEGGVPRHQSAASGGTSAAPATDQNSDGLLGLERELDDDSDLSLTPVPGIIQTVDLSELRAACADGSTVQTMSGAERDCL